MPLPQRKPVEANDGSYGGLVLQAFDNLPRPTWRAGGLQAAKAFPAPWQADYGSATNVVVRCAAAFIGRQRRRKVVVRAYDGDVAEVVAAAPKLFAAAEHLLAHGAWHDDGTFVYSPPSPHAADDGREPDPAKDAVAALADLVDTLGAR